MQEILPNNNQTQEQRRSSFSVDQHDDDDDKKTILSSTDSNRTISDQYHILRNRFITLSKERRLLSCILILYILILFGLFAIIILLLRAFQATNLIIYEQNSNNGMNTNDGIVRYGESCTNFNECQRPFICYKKNSSLSGICRCPLKYDYINNQCIGDLNASCKRDSDCQRYMMCLGMNDGTRRCQCQTSYNYDFEQKQCRGEYETSCESHTDCQFNLLCEKTNSSSICSCQTNYHYDRLMKKCRGNPGATCDLTTENNCIENAECRDGICECAYQYISNKNKICVDPCLKLIPHPIRIRYPGTCRRFIDCQQRSKHECPDKTIFNFRTQLCDYPKNVLDCQ